MTKTRKGIGMGAGVLALAGLVVVGLAATGTGPFSATDSGQNEMVNVDDYGIDGKISLPTAASSADVYLFRAEPENFGNYAEWDAAEAKSGQEVGVDYEEKTGVSSDTVTFDDLESGTYYLVIEDANFNTVFAQVTQPEQVTQVYADNDKAVNLAKDADTSTAASYGSDNVVSYDDEGSVLGTGNDLPAPSSDGTETFSIQRTIDVDTGVSLLGNLETTSFNDGDGIEDVEVTVMADGSQVYSKSLKDGSSGELADGTSFAEDLSDNVDMEPVRSADKITVEYEVTANLGTGSAAAGDGVLQDSEAIVTTGLDDVYEADVSTATKAYTR